MRLGHLMLCDQREGQSPQKRYEEMMEEVRLMDELGYWSVWFAEHHFDGYSLIPDSLLWCAAAARETKQIRSVPCTYGMVLKWQLKSDKIPATRTSSDLSLSGHRARVLRW